MNLQQAKDQVAKEIGYEDYKCLAFDLGLERDIPEVVFTDRLCELYTQSQVNDALDKAIELSKDFVKNAYRYQLEGRNYIEELKRLRR